MGNEKEIDEVGVKNLLSFVKKVKAFRECPIVDDDFNHLRDEVDEMLDYLVDMHNLKD